MSRPALRAKLWIRGLIFTVLVPGVVGVVLPSIIYRGHGVRGGLWEAGWILVAAGATVYGLCLFRFLTSGGTPAIFFTRRFRTLVGEEPDKLVQDWLYRISRNPMYVGVLLVVFGQALLFASIRVACYGIALWLFFHLTVVFQEEPHLRKVHGPSYDEYSRRVPRWFGPFR
jgi:protein-S-isoprenylcysteine O-methyltransferase Ste14